MTSNLILIGPPGTGKSQLLANVVERHDTLHWRGFTSVSIIEDNERIGWTIAGVNSAHGTLAHIDLKSDIHMGRYGIDLNLFASIVDTELDPTQPADAYVIDGIGLISAMHPPFADLLDACLEGKTPVIAIAREKSTEMLPSLEARPDTRILRVEARHLDSIASLMDDRLRNR